MLAMRGEQLGVVTNWPPSLEAALQRWGTISPKAPCLTTMDTNGKPLYILTYGNSLGSPRRPPRSAATSRRATPRIALRVRHSPPRDPGRKRFRNILSLIRKVITC